MAHVLLTLLMLTVASESCFNTKNMGIRQKDEPNELKNNVNVRICQNKNVSY